MQVGRAAETGHAGCSPCPPRCDGICPRWKGVLRKALVSALGAAILLGTPLIAQADQGKWWKPNEGREAERQERQDRGWHRGRDRGDRGDRGGAWRQQADRGDRGSWRSD